MEIVVLVIADLIYGLVLASWKIRCNPGAFRSARELYGTQEITSDLMPVAYSYFIILVYAMRRLQYDEFRGNLNYIVKVLDKLKGLQREIGDDGYLGWFIGCTMQLFDEDHTRNYNGFYPEIKKYSNECRKALRQNSTCCNTRCKVSVADCKYVCSKCRCGIYCSRRCQKYDWNRGDHQRLCKMSASAFK